MEENFSDEFYSRWQHLLEDIDMSEIPLPFIKEITANLAGGGTIDFNISEMIAKNMTTDEIEQVIQEFLDSEDYDVVNLEFHINVRKVADEVTHRTAKILDE
jgi:hypothetical protein